MRRARHLFEQVASFEALWLASRRARRGKRRSAGTAMFEHHLERELLRLERELNAGTFRFSGYRSFEIREPAPRVIRAAPYRDRVVHHALCAQLEPLLERGMIEDSYACRVGKGTHAALARVERFMRGGGWVVKLDVRKYFYAIDHAILLAQLERRVADPRVMALVRQLLETYDASGELAYPMPGSAGDEVPRPRGLPIGNLTSQLFANAFLTPVDRFIKDELRVRRYVRYMDDLVLIAPDRETARRWLSELIPRLLEIRLLPHPRKTQILPARNGVRFLGFHVYPHGRRILRGNLQRFARRMRARASRVRAGRLGMTRVERSLMAWLGFAGLERHRAFLNAVLASLPFQPGDAMLPRTFWFPEAQHGEG